MTDAARDDALRRGETIPAMTAAAAERFGDRLAVVDGDTRLSYAELFEEARTFGAALVASGVRPGDRVSIWAFNSVEWVVAALGLWQAGAVLVPVNTRFKGAEAGDILARSRARALVTVTDFLDTDYVALLGAVGVPDCVDEIVVLAGPVPDVPGTATVGWDGFMARAGSVEPDVIAARVAALAPDDVSTIIFTSGTTGAPKGAMLRHGASVRAYTAWAGVVGLGADDRYLIVNPFFHTFGLNAGIVACLITGATIVPHAVFDVPAVMARVD
jgi:HIP---CoA ligase